VAPVDEPENTEPDDQEAGADLNLPVTYPLIATVKTDMPERQPPCQTRHWASAIRSPRRRAGGTAVRSKNDLDVKEIVTVIFGPEAPQQ
jgi:hypothetical protein